jgi:hypothetical protein
VRKGFLPGQARGPQHVVVRDRLATQHAGPHVLAQCDRLGGPADCGGSDGIVGVGTDTVTKHLHQFLDPSANDIAPVERLARLPVIAPLRCWRPAGNRAAIDRQIRHAIGPPLSATPTDVVT